MTLIFEDLPRRSDAGPEVDWNAVGEALKARPGEWARVAVYRAHTTAATVAYQINGRIRHTSLLLHGQFEAKSRTVDGEFRVYVRYVGEAGSEATPKNDLPLVGPGSTSPEPGPRAAPSTVDELCCPAYPNCHEPVPGVLVELPPLPPKWQGEEYLTRQAAEPTKGGTDD